MKARIAKLTSQGRVTIPADIRKKYNIKTGITFSGWGEEDKNDS